MMPGAQHDCGYCRTSLDHQPPQHLRGSSDPRCPRDCPYKAPQHIAQRFTKQLAQHGPKAAARNARAHFLRVSGNYLGVPGFISAPSSPAAQQSGAKNG